MAAVEAFVGASPADGVDAVLVDTAPAGPDFRSINIDGNERQNRILRTVPLRAAFWRKSSLSSLATDGGASRKGSPYRRILSQRVVVSGPETETCGVSSAMGKARRGRLRYSIQWNTSCF